MLTKKVYIVTMEYYPNSLGLYIPLRLYVNWNLPDLFNEENKCKDMILEYELDCV